MNVLWRVIWYPATGQVMTVRTVTYGILQRNTKSQIPCRPDMSLPLSRRCVSTVIPKL